MRGEVIEEMRVNRKKLKRRKRSGGIRRVIIVGGEVTEMSVGREREEKECRKVEEKKNKKGSKSGERGR